MPLDSIKPTIEQETSIKDLKRSVITFFFVTTSCLTPVRQEWSDFSMPITGIRKSLTQKGCRVSCVYLAIK